MEPAVAIAAIVGTAVLAALAMGILMRGRRLPSTEGFDAGRERLDQQLTDMRRQIGDLAGQLRVQGEQTTSLASVATSLRESLGSAQARGQWGERLADDILRTVGLVEGINYRKQVTQAGIGTRPDFVFLLPGGLRLNMDVKFPFDNYRRFVEAGSDPERDAARTAFLRDVRGRLKELAGREYVDPEGGTVDYALLFIPNEAIYSFIHEQQPQVLDEGLQNGVVCCSPHMLFGMLALVNQASRTLRLQRASEDVVAHLGRFEAEWAKFTGALDTLGGRLASAQRAFEDISGPRRRALEKPLARIEALRRERGPELALPEPDGEV